MNNPNCGTCGMLNSRGFCSLTACRFPVSCTAVVWAPPPRTNADRIRAMSDEELAMLLEGCVCPKKPCPDIDRDTPTDKKRCTECWLDWLKEEVEE